MNWMTIILAATPTTPSMSGLFARLAVMAAIGIGACLALVMYSRRRGGPIGPGGGRLIHVADLSLERRGTLHLVGIGSRRIVVRADPSGLKALTLLRESFAGAMKPMAQPNQETLASADDLGEHALHIIRDAETP